MSSLGDRSLRRVHGPAGLDPAAPAAHLELLGGFAFEVGGDPLTVPLHMQRLLAFLALQRRPLHRAYVAGKLWLELSQEHAYGCLRSTLWRLGRLPDPVVRVSSTHLALDPAVAVDAHELAVCVERALQGRDTQAADVTLLVGAGELLPDWYDEWVLQERERTRLLRLLALEAAGEDLMRERRYPEAIVAALAAIGADPLRESAHRLLIRLHLETGNAAAAVRQFDALRSLLRDRVGLEPSAQTAELLEGLALAGRY